MKKNLPPLNALRAFEAAARNLSITKAAQELHVTHAAISQQVKLLEDYLKLPLLYREGRRIKLTNQGEVYALALGTAFSTMKQATENLFNQSDPNVITVRMPLTFTMSWFIPRMRDFQEANPDLELRLSTMPREIDFAQENIDLAIYYGNGDWPGLHKDFLLDDCLFPVCSPRLLDQKLTLRSNKDLTAFKFIYVTADLRKKDWPLWFKAAKLSEPTKSSRLYFHDTILALQAAQAGLGVAIAHGPFVKDFLENGQLVAFSDIQLKLPDKYYLVCPESHLSAHKVKKFRSWLLNEVKKFTAKKYSTGSL